MNYSYSFKIYFSCLCVSLCCFIVRAEDIMTRDRTVYKNVEILKVSAVGVRFKDSTGKQIFLPYIRLDSEMVKAFKESIKDKKETWIYKYRGNEISYKRFKKLFNYFRDYLFYDYVHKKVLDIRSLNGATADELLQLNANSQKGDYGIYNLQVVKIINDHALLAEPDCMFNNPLKFLVTPIDTSKYTVAFLDDFTESSLDNTEKQDTFSAPFLVGGEHLIDSGAMYQVLIPLKQLTKVSFKKYLDRGHGLYLLKERTRIVKGHKAKVRKCNRCRGTGRIFNDDPSTRVSHPFLVCPKCKGKGYKLLKRKTDDVEYTYWEKVLIK